MEIHPGLPHKVSTFRSGGVRPSSHFSKSRPFATNHREVGVAAVLRALALLHDVENELKGMKVPPVPGNGNGKNGDATGGDRLQLAAGGGSREMDPSSEKDRHRACERVETS